MEITQTAITTYGLAIEKSSDGGTWKSLLWADNVASTLDRRKREDPAASESQQGKKKSRKDPTSS